MTGQSPMRNLAGDELTPSEEELVHTYRHLHRALAMYGEEMAPYQRRNGLKALAALWQVMNGLDMDPGQLYEIGA